MVSSAIPLAAWGDASHENAGGRVIDSTFGRGFRVFWVLNMALDGSGRVLQLSAVHVLRPEEQTLEDMFTAWVRPAGRRKWATARHYSLSPRSRGCLSFLVSLWHKTRKPTLDSN